MDPNKFEELSSRGHILRPQKSTSDIPNMFRNPFSHAESHLGPHWENVLARRSEGLEPPQSMSRTSAVPEPLFSWRPDKTESQPPSLITPGAHQKPLPGSELPPSLIPGRRQGVSHKPDKTDRKLDLPSVDQQMNLYDSGISPSTSQPARLDNHSLKRQLTQRRVPAIITAPAQLTTGRGHSSRRPHARQESIILNDNEFQLFAEATAGLGPGFTPRLTVSSMSWVHGHGLDESSSECRQVSNAGDLITSTVQTPTVLLERYYSAAVPAQLRPAGGDDALLHQNIPRRSSSVYSEHPWAPLQPTTDSDIKEEDEGLLDDELPDYADSQAQMIAVARAEAARRAEDLKKRWQERD